jgi:hypothetical protein
MNRTKRNWQIVLLAGSLISSPAIAQQHEEHHPAAPKATSTSMDTAGCPHMKAAEPTDQLLTSFAAIESEKEMAALQQKLADHGKLLKELKATTEQKCPMMEMKGRDMTGGGMMGDDKMSMPGMQHSDPAQ